VSSHPSTRRGLLGLTIALALGLGAAAPALAATQTFSNTNPLTIPAGAPGTTLGNASPYPAAISVSGMGGLITDVNAKVENLGHTHPDDLDILLVSPSGDSTVLMSDACNAEDFEDFDYTFDDDAASTMSDAQVGVTCSSFFYKPSAYDPASDTWPAAFPGPHGTTLARFNGENPNGIWHLYVRDDSAGDVGDMEQGWSLTITTGTHSVRIPATGSSGIAGPYPATQTVAGETGVVTDVNVVGNGFTHSHPDDVDLLLVGPRGQSVMLMSDACGSHDVANYFWRWDDEAALAMPDSGSTNVCSAFSYRPTDHTGGDSLPAPAPQAPYGSALSAFDLTDPNGDWRFYIADDVGGDEGFLINPLTVELTTRPGAATSFAAGAIELSETVARTLSITRSGVDAFGAGSVRVVAKPGSADASDYSPLDTVLDFAPGETVKTVDLQVRGDGKDEPAEQFTVALESPAGDVTPAAPAAVTVTIPGQGQLAGPGGAGRQGDAVKPSFSLSQKRLALGKGRKVGVAVGPATNEAGPTMAAVVLSAKLPRKKGKPKLAAIGTTRGVAMAPGKAKVVTVKVSRKAAAAVKALGALAVTVQATVTDGSGNATSLSRAMKLKPAPRPKRKS
jgi:subtilisin-like proprotein convertase family protein